MSPATTELLLTRESMIPKFETWKELFVANRNHVMGRRTGHEMEEGEEGKSESRTRCAVI
jgi:hypothetical protein